MCQMIATGNFPFMLFALASACLRRPAAHRVAPLLRTRSSRRSRSSLDSSFLGRLFEATLHEVLGQRREEPRGLRPVRLAEEREVDRGEGVPRDLAVLHEPDALRRLVKLLLHLLRVLHFANKTSDLGEVDLLLLADRDVLWQLGEHAELRLVRRPALEPDPCQRDAAPKLSAFECAEQCGLALLRLVERLDARDLQPVGHDAEADAVSG